MQHSLSNISLNQLDPNDLINKKDNELFKLIILNYNNIIKEIEHNKIKYNFSLQKINRLESLINTLFLHVSYLIFILAVIIFCCLIIILIN